MAALWSGQKPADMSGSTTNPSDHKEAKTSTRTVSHTEKERQQNKRFILDLDQIGNIAKHPPGLCGGRSFNKDNRARRVGVTVKPSCVICRHSVCVKWLEDSNFLTSEDKAFDFALLLIRIISDVELQIKISASGTVATKRSARHQWRGSVRLLTFCEAGHGERNADDPHQVLYRYQRPQNSSDTYCFTFASVD